MNRIKFGILGIVMICGLAGCAKDPGTMQPAAGQQEAVEAGSAAGDASGAAGAEQQEGVAAGTFFSRGVYEAYEDGELSRYFCFYDAESGRVENASDGMGVGFACEQKADEIIFHMGSADDETIMKMEKDDAGNISGAYADGSASYTFKQMENADPETFDPATGMGENAEGMVDIEGSETFNDIIEKLESGQGHAYATIDGTEVLLVTPATFKIEKDMAAMSADVYACDKAGIPHYLGYVSSDGTAYPISIFEQKLYSGGHHRMTKSTVMDGKLITLEESNETFEEDGTPVYHFSSDDGAGSEESKDSTTFDRLVDEFMHSKPVTFTVVK